MGDTLRLKVEDYRVSSSTPMRSPRAEDFLSVIPVEWLLAHQQNSALPLKLL